MKKILYNKFDKNQISSLPVVTFEGRIIVILTPGETEKAVDYLLSRSILGVDTETRPSFKRGFQYKVSLLQVSTEDTCFLFRLQHTGMTPAIIRFLEDKTVPKIGLSWHDDLNGLHKLADFTPGRFIDLQQHMREIGIEDMSLQKLYANIFGQKISKKMQLSNWERDILDEKQKRYAATDAWACVMLYKELQRLEHTKDYELRITQEHEENISEKR
jgi:ribonuclease D